MEEFMRGSVILVALGAFLVLVKGPAAAVLPDDGTDLGFSGRNVRDDSRAETAHITVKFLRRGTGIPPVRWVSVRLEVKNERDRPMWIVTRYRGDEPLPNDGKFTGSHFPQPFVGKGYRNETGGLIEIEYLANRSFMAFLLPAKSSFHFEGYVVEAWKDIREMEFWEVEMLRVNGTTPLEKWLPYNTMSDKRVEVRKGANWDNLDWDPNLLKSRTDYPKEKVQFVQAYGCKKWMVPITGLVEE
jgi:hypothetical protein